MADKDQSQVWAEVRKQQSAMAVEVQNRAPAAAPQFASTSSYARVMENVEVKNKWKDPKDPVDT